MSSNSIVPMIKEACNDDKNMQSFLLNLLEFTLTGRSWYKDEYYRLIEKYSNMTGGKNED